jgi:hypothetical protein
MALYDEWQEARRAEASGLDNGTRSSYMEWLMERQVLGTRTLIRLILDVMAEANAEPAEEGEDEPEDADGADPE